MVADPSRMFEGHEVTDQEEGLFAAIQGLSLVYASLEEHQREAPLCKDLLEASKMGDPTVTKFRLHNNILCFQPRGAKTRSYVAPAYLRLILKYFHDSPMSGHLGPFKTWKKVGHTCYWPKLREDVFHYVRHCDLCQRAKPAQDNKVWLHTATPASYPLERVFIDFMGPLIRTKKGNQVILVVIVSF